jgi:aminoglycoside 3-N-acetyltransferase
MWSRLELAGDFRALGVREGGVVMLHASVRSVGEVAGGPDQIHLALRDALGPTGTLMMYIGCPSYYDDVGRGVLTAAHEREVLEKHPAFNPQTARAARSHGILAEFFRTWPGTIVNDHATRFAAAGGHAGVLLKEHPWDFAYAADSPLDRFRQLAGTILLLGSDHDEVTFLHHVEHMVDFPDKKITCFKVPYERGGSIEWRTAQEVDSNAAHANWPDRFFAQIVDRYLEHAGNHGRRVGDATAFLIPSQDLYRFAGPIMQATATSVRL